MADGVFNISLGKVAYYATLPAASDGIVWVLCKAANLVADATLRDYDDLATLFAGATDEADFTGYARVIGTAATVTVDDVNERVDVDYTTDPSFTNTGGTAQSIGKLISCYDPDTTTGTDSSLIPLTFHDYLVTADAGSTITAQLAAAGFYRAA